MSSQLVLGSRAVRRAQSSPHLDYDLCLWRTNNPLQPLDRASTGSATAPKPNFVQKLPVELVIEILRWFSMTNGGWLDLDWAYGGLWSVISVSRQWRTAASTASELWSKIRYNPRSVQTHCPKVIATRLEIALQTSTGPLILNFQPDVPQKLLPLLVQHSSRWLQIHLTVNEQSLLSLLKLANDEPLHLERLERLSIGVPFQRGYHSVLAGPDLQVLHPDPRTCLWGRHFGDLFSIAPKLARLQLDNIFDVESLRIPWPQISHFTTRNDYDAESRSYAHSFSLLELMPQLESYDVEHAKLESRGVEDKWYWDLQNLKFLRVKDLDSLAFKHLNVPNLKTLHWPGWSYTICEFPDIKRLVDIVHMSRCETLRTLYWDDTDDFNEGRFESAVRFPEIAQVTTLHIRSTEHGHTERMLQTINSRNVFPNLQNIHLILPRRIGSAFDNGELEREFTLLTRRFYALRQSQSQNGDLTKELHLVDWDWSSPGGKEFKASRCDEEVIHHYEEREDDRHDFFE